MSSVDTNLPSWVAEARDCEFCAQPAEIECERCHNPLCPKHAAGDWDIAIFCPPCFDDVRGGRP